MKAGLGWVVGWYLLFTIPIGSSQFGIVYAAWGVASHLSYHRCGNTPRGCPLSFGTKVTQYQSPYPPPPQQSHHHRHHQQQQRQTLFGELAGKDSINKATNNDYYIDDGHDITLQGMDRSNDRLRKANKSSNLMTRRSSLVHAWIRSALTIIATVVTTTTSQGIIARAAVGSLPEYANTNAILQGITIVVADQSQQDAMIAFLQDGFGAQILRKRRQGVLANTGTGVGGSSSSSNIGTGGGSGGAIEETWMGYGPEQLSIPPDFVIPVSSLGEYGGHSSIHIRYDPTQRTPLYRIGDTTPPGTSIAYLQIAVPEYRISQMVRQGGAILDAYGYVNVISPSGLPIRGIVGIAPDPIMFLAIYCTNVDASKTFYETLGFVTQDYPYARPSRGLGQFEPPQPPKSVYMAPTGNGMGILLLPTPKRNFKVTANPVVESLRIVYNPTSTPSERADDDSATMLSDPSGIPIQFQSVVKFEEEERITR